MFEPKNKKQKAKKNNVKIPKKRGKNNSKNPEPFKKTQKTNKP